MAWHPLPNPYYSSNHKYLHHHDGCKLQNVANGPTWCEELVTLGYGPPLPPPNPAVQMTLCAIDLPNLHKLIQGTDNAALNEVDEEGVHTPLLFVTATYDPSKLVANLKEKKKKNTC